MKVFKFSFLFLLLALSLNVHAQQHELRLNLHYSYAMPLGNFKNDVISNSSPRGVTGDLLYGINNKISVGLGLGFQDFYQKYPRDLYPTGDHETTSAVLSNSVQIMPVLAKVEVYPFSGKRASVQPYISAGAGLDIISFTQYLGEFGGSNNSAGLMLQGGAGFKVPFNATGSAGLSLGANYNMVNYKKNGFDNFNNVNFQAGLYFPLR
jgi:hypothetical protein